MLYSGNQILDVDMINLQVKPIGEQVSLALMLFPLVTISLHQFSPFSYS